MWRVGDLDDVQAMARRRHPIGQVVDGVDPIGEDLGIGQVRPMHTAVTMARRTPISRSTRSNASATERRRSPSDGSPSVMRAARGSGMVEITVSNETDASVTQVDQFLVRRRSWWRRCRTGSTRATRRRSSRPRSRSPPQDRRTPRSDPPGCRGPRSRPRGPLKIDRRDESAHPIRGHLIRRDRPHLGVVRHHEVPRHTGTVGAEDPLQERRGRRRTSLRRPKRSGGRPGTRR